MHDDPRSHFPGLVRRGPMLATLLLRAAGLVPWAAMLVLLLAASFVYARLGTVGLGAVMLALAVGLLGRAMPHLRDLWERARTLYTFRHGALSLDDAAVYSGAEKALDRSEISGVECLAFEGEAEVVIGVRRPGRRAYAHVLRAPREVARSFASALGADLLQPPELTAPLAFSSPVAGGLGAKLLRLRHAYGGLFVPLWVVGLLSAAMLGGATMFSVVVALGVLVGAAMLGASLRLGRIDMLLEGLRLVPHGQRRQAELVPWSRVMAVDRAPNVLLLTVLAADGDDTETVVLRPAHPGARWRLAAALQTHLAAARARRRGTALVEALAQGGRTVDAWSAALARLTTGVQGYREGPGASPEALWLMASDETADVALRVAALVALAGGGHLDASSPLWSLCQRDPAVAAAVPEALAAGVWDAALAARCLAAVAEPVPGTGTGVRIAVTGARVGEDAEEAENGADAARGRGGR